MKNAVFSPRFLVNALLAAAVLALLLRQGAAVAAGVRQGLLYLGGTLIPALFPFLILSEWLTKSGAGRALTRPLTGPVSRLTGLSRPAAAALLLGFICGTPVGCLTAADLWKRGEIDEGDRDRLMLFSCNPGLGFMAGAVGAACGDRGRGILLWVLLLFSALTLCTLSRFLFTKTGKAANIPQNGIKKAAFDLPSCVTTATQNMVKIAGFYLAACALLGGLTPWLSRLPPLPRAAICGGLELSAGVEAAAALSPRGAFLFCAALCGFAGLTIALQLRSLAGTAAPPLPLYLSARLAVGALCLFLAQCAWRFARRAVPAARFTFSTQATTWARMLPLLFFACSLCLFAAFRKAKRQK